MSDLFHKRIAFSAAQKKPLNAIFPIPLILFPRDFPLSHHACCGVRRDRAKLHDRCPSISYTVLVVGDAFKALAFGESGASPMTAAAAGPGDRSHSVMLWIVLLSISC